MSALTFRYRTGWIHVSSLSENREIIRVQVDACAYAIEVRSVHAAKLAITKHMKRIMK
jgi:hypothetical protein